MMNTKPVLTLTEVNLILDRAQAEAEANGWPVTIAVADDGGHLLGLRRLDNAAPFTALIATEKARSAGISGKETQVFEDMINNGRNAFLSAPLEGLMAGGVPVMINGQRAGSVGISGVQPAQDIQIAKAGIEAVMAASG
jgi:glc operon protein GlcG